MVGYWPTKTVMGPTESVFESGEGPLPRKAAVAQITQSYVSLSRRVVVVAVVWRVVVGVVVVVVVGGGWLREGWWVFCVVLLCVCVSVFKCTYG